MSKIILQEHTTWVGILIVPSGAGGAGSTLAPGRSDEGAGLE